MKIKDFKYTKREFLLLIAASLVIGFILSFRLWGGSSYDVNSGIENFIKISLLTFIALIIHYSVEKIYGVMKGISVTYTFPAIANGAGLVFTFLTNGLLFFFSPGNLKFEVHQHKRIGKYRSRVIFEEFGFIVGAGILTSLIIAAIFSMRTGFIAEQFVKINLFIAVFSLIPLPTFEGFHMLASSILYYATILGFTFAFVAVLLLTSPLYAFLFGILGAILGFFLHHNHETKLDKNY